MTHDLKIITRPTAEHLAEVFGAGALWRPTETPAKLVDAETLEFLRTTGFPAVKFGRFDIDSSTLPVKGPWEADADEIFGRRDPDDDSPPTAVSYAFATYNEYHLMVDGKTGAVEVYYPSGWDHGEGHQGLAFDGIAELAGAMALLKRCEERIEAGEAPAAIADLRATIGGLGWGDAHFWEWIFEGLEDEFGEG
ncbi:SUKH-4 family immunity protein [Phytomonospora endophytica]|uniref:SUKH-4 immunity protein of toxin-antitoxin system n=1 Tax=Phytomonospora endophytica TaxID=714109 RepID=A0A841FG99_9ACTN|nr:SUKH-4 family immunity protein [Phytomonospora endophytica]MBB6032572.1 hypothetical protein [Phytomonospora endophytica]